MDSTASNTPFYEDKGFWAMLLAPLFAYLNSKFNLSLSAAEIVGLVLPVVAYIVGHKYKSAQVLVAEIQASAAKIAAATPAPSAAAALSAAAK